MRNRITLFPIAWMLAAVAAPAWGQAVGVASSATKSAPDALSESDGVAFARAMLEAIEAGDREGFNALMDWDALFRNMVRGLDVSGKELQQILAGARRALEGEEHGLGSQYIKIFKQGGSLHFLRTRQGRGRRVALFRLIKPAEQGGFNYLEFALERPPGGRVRATDIYTYASGEFISESMRRSLLPVMTNRSRTAPDKLVNGEGDLARDFPRMGQALMLLNQGKPQEAHAIFKTLRPETRRQKVVLIGRLQAAHQVKDEKEYAATLQEFREAFPDDPCLDLVLIDAFLLQGDLAGAMKAVDRLDKSVGGDAYLDLLRAKFCEARGDLKEARRFARQAVEREPSLLLAHWSAVAYSLESKDYDETLALLKEIDRRFPMTFNDLTKAPAYAGFVRSPQYARWLDHLKAKAGSGPVKPPEASSPENR